MPIDLLAQPQQPTQPIDLLGAQARSSAAPSFLDHLSDVMGDVAVGGARFGRGMLDFPHNLAVEAAHPSPRSALVKSLQSVGGLGGRPIDPRIASKLASIIPHPFSSVDYEKAYGVHPGLGGKTIEDIAQYAPAMLTGGETVPIRAVASTLYGATQAKVPAKGALVGGLTGLVGETAPGLIVKGAKAFRLPSMAKGIMKYLSKGEGFEQAGKTIANAAKNTYERLYNNVGNAYKAVFNKVGEKSIPLSNLPEEQINNLGIHLKPQYNDFLKNPTFQEAHNLQSDIGKEIGEIKDARIRRGLTDKERVQLDALAKTRETIHSDMSDFIDTKHPELRGQYQTASDLFKSKIVPFLENKRLYKMAKGRDTNPKNVVNIFKNPEPGLQDIVNEMGQGTKNRIIYQHIATSPYKLTGERLLNRTAELDKQGLISYLHPEVASKLDRLQSAVNLKKGISPLIGGVLGGYGAHSLGPAATSIATMGGMMVAPSLTRAGSAIAKLGSPIVRGIAESPIARRAAESGLARKAILSRAIQSILTPEMVRRFGE